MSKLGKSLIVVVILVFMSFGIFQGMVTHSLDVKTVYAASSELTDVNSRVAHLKKSLHSNYLGIKNQGQWQEYIKELRVSISKIPLSEAAETKEIIEFVNKAEALVNGLSRINQVEKSMESNFLGIKNIRQWSYYIILGEFDLSKVDQKEFSKEYNELIERMKKCQDIIGSVEADFEEEFNKALNIYYKAESSRKVEDAKTALDVANKLGTCEESDYLKNECKMLLVRLGEIKLSQDETILQEAYKKLDRLLAETGISIGESSEEKVKAEIVKVVGSTINISVNKTFINPSSGDETYKVVLSKGSASMHPILLEFSSAK